VSKKTCEGCGKLRSDLKPQSDPDAPRLCFLCRKEARAGRYFNAELGAYVFPADSR